MAKRPFGPLVSGKVRLRPLEECDLPLTLAWRNQDHIRKWFFTSSVITPEQHTAWFRSYREHDDDFVFIIEDLSADGRSVGQVALYHVDWVGRRAEFGRLMIGEPAAAGQGLAKAATQALVTGAFADLGLNEVYLEVMADNHPARAIYERCDFSVTGVRDAVVLMARKREGAVAACAE
jgi:RimJ/RimL family protein N-acetyltransferase